MIRKIDIELNIGCNLSQFVYYTKHYEPGCGSPFEVHPADVRSVAARIGEARRRHQWAHFLDRAESREPLGEFAEKSAGRDSDGAGRFLHARRGRQAAGVLPAGGTR